MCQSLEDKVFNPVVSITRVTVPFMPLWFILLHVLPPDPAINHSQPDIQLCIVSQLHTWLDLETSRQTRRGLYPNWEDSRTRYSFPVARRGSQYYNILLY